MMKTLVSAVLLACTGTSIAGTHLAAAAQAQVLNVHYTAGDYSRETCFESGQGGLTRHPSMPNEWCTIKLPIELPAGKTIQQITVLYGTDGAPGEGYVVGGLLYGDLMASSDYADFNNGFNGGWSSLSQPPVSDQGVGEGHLMQQVTQVYPPMVIYPEAFVMNTKRVYFVGVSTVGTGEFFGLRVLYY